MVLKNFKHTGLSILINEPKLQCPNFKLIKYVLKNLSKRRCSVVKYLIPFFCPDNVLSHFAPIICRILKRFLVFRFIATDTLAQNHKCKTLKNPEFRLRNFTGMVPDCFQFWNILKIYINYIGVQLLLIKLFLFLVLEYFICTSIKENKNTISVVGRCKNPVGRE